MWAFLSTVLKNLFFFFEVRDAQNNIADWNGEISPQNFWERWTRKEDFPQNDPNFFSLKKVNQPKGRMMNQGPICSYQWDAVPTGTEQWFHTLLSSHPAPLKEGCGVQDGFSETVAFESSWVSISSSYQNPHPVMSGDTTVMSGCSGARKRLWFGFSNHIGHILSFLKADEGITWFEINGGKGFHARLFKIHNSVIQSQVSQKEKNKYYTITYICAI